MKEARKIKGLKSQLKILEGAAESLNSEIKIKQRELSLKHKSIEELKTKIKNTNIKSGLKVSEHAVLRYLERVEGLDISEVEKQILTEEVRGLIDKLGGNGTYPNKDFKIKLKDYTVVTIV